MLNRYAPDFDQFRRLAARYSRVPVTATIVADDLTPVSAFARLCGTNPRAFLFESVVGGERVARYSFLASDPIWTLEAHGDAVTLIRHRDAARKDWRSDDPLRELDTLLREYRSPPLPDMPRFLGGAVGYAGYDVVRYYEHLPNAPPDDRHLPDLLFDLYETLVLFDHVNKTMTIVQHCTTDDGMDADSLRIAYEAAIRNIERQIDQLSNGVAGLKPMRAAPPFQPLSRYSSNLSRERFESMVEQAKEYIRAGDIFQVVLSQRLRIDTPAAPFDVYRALRVVNPSPFMFYFKSPQLTLVGASPEVLCRVENGIVVNRPLAGTRRRGANPDEDRRLRDELLSDPKERAEHIMLVDLGRNDVGRVCEPGSIRLNEVMQVEFYSHVMHISSTVTGTLCRGLNALDALRATLPVGTVSGAPKVRAMQIIDELEPTRRGPYAGAVGYVDFCGNMDTCIALRTLVFAPQHDGTHQVFAQVGAGIVAESAPAAEYQETINKANGMLAAIAVAEQN